MREELRPEDAPISFSIEFWVNGLGIPYVTSGNEHGATGDADGRTPRTHVVATSEGGPAGCESVKVWCVDIRVSKCADGLIREVVCKEEQNVRLLRDSVGGREKGVRGDQDGEKQGEWVTGGFHRSGLKVYRRMEGALLKRSL